MMNRELGLAMPGVKRKEIEISRFPKRERPLRTGVPVFLGYATEGSINKPKMLRDWSLFEQIFEKAAGNSFLAYAVRGFFENGGQICYVVRLDDPSSPVVGLRKGLQCLEELVIEGKFDLVCAPDMMRFPEADRETMQKEILDYCDRQGNLFAILDALPDADVDAVLKQREKLGSRKNGALYYPWVQVPDLNPNQKGSDLGQNKNIWVPPCGHVAGIYARSDQRVGVHKAPANEELEGVQDLRMPLTQKNIKYLNRAGVNCLRAFPGRGIRVWGARTLSQEEKWRYVNVRRLFHHVSRWIERFMIKITYEPNNARLRARIVRELTFYFEGLFSQGALRGATAEQAFYVKCDAENNPRDVSDAGMVITEIGLAPAIPSEFIEVRITHDDSGVRIVDFSL